MSGKHRSLEALPTPSGRKPDLPSYVTYCGLELLLEAQKPRTRMHEEMMFIITTQVSELWFKAAFHELEAVRRAIRSDELESGLSLLTRAREILRQLANTLDVLGTLAPQEFNRIREGFGDASGFQSFAYRRLEFVLGKKDARLIRPYRASERISGMLAETLRAPSVYDEAIRLLHRRGFTIADSCRQRDWTGPYRSHPSVELAWSRAYGLGSLHPLCTLGERLLDVDALLQQWRHRHLVAAQRQIGAKRGSAGTPGVEWLNRMIEHRYFPELWSIRTVL